MLRAARWVFLCLTLLVQTAIAQERFSIFVGSAQENVERMIQLAELRDDDVVIDLGSGDGRIVLTAAKANKRLRGWGVDIDEKLVAESNAHARSQGVAERVQFFKRDVFDADIRGATVITMWMWPEMQRMLRTKILNEATPGTRVITPIWGMGTWPPDKVDNYDNSPVHLWIVPARVEGYWRWELPVEGVPRSYAAVLEQQFQKAEGVVRVENRRGVLEDMKLVGANIQFKLDMTLGEANFITHRFSGQVRGNEIIGTVTLQRVVEDATVTTELPWRATRALNSGYFSPAATPAVTKTP